MSLLRGLYALAIAVLIPAFVGFGISAFYPEPEFPEYPPELEFSEPNGTPEQERLFAEHRQDQEAYQERFSSYNQVVAAIAIAAAVLLLVGSLLWVGEMPVVGDGATLGAVFTLFYGLVRALMAGNEQFRFFAVAVGLAVLLALVYWKFVRAGRRSGPE